jgi:hypothetical protein
LADLQCGKSSSLAPGASWSLNFRSETPFAAPQIRAGKCNFVRAQKTSEAVKYRNNFMENSKWTFGI